MSSGDDFEPFELDDVPARARRTRQPVRIDSDFDVPQVACPSCGEGNSPTSLHCRECGARLTQGPLPVAPPPMIRTTAGARALVVIAGTLLIVALGALVYNAISSDNPAPSTTRPTTSSSQPGASAPAAQQLAVANVRVSSALSKFPGEALIDGDAATEWQDQSQEGKGASLVFEFSQPVAISRIEIVPILDAERFQRNFRIKDLVIKADDLPDKLPFTLPDANQAQNITLATLKTQSITIDVSSTYPAVGLSAELPAFKELVVAEVKFYGQAAPSAATTTAPGTTAP